MYRTILIIASTLFLTCHINAQRKWTLDECMQYATEHNINIQQRIIEIKNRDVQLNSSRNLRLPDVNASIGEKVSWGNYSASTGTMQVMDPSVNTDLSYTAVGISASMPLFEGFRISNRIKADRFLLEAATANLEQARKDLRIQIATYYLQCLYYKNIVEVTRVQVEVSRQLLQRATDLVEKGRRPRSERSNAAAILSGDEYTLADAIGQEELARLTLAQLLNLPNANDFDVAPLNDTQMQSQLPMLENIYNHALETHPSILSAKSLISAADSEIKIARSGYYPTLSLQAALNTFSVKMFNMTLNPNTMFRQFDVNKNAIIGLQLNIPVFNRYTTRNNIRQAKLSKQNQMLALDNARLELRKEIETAWKDAQVSEAKHQAALRTVQATSESVDLEESSYEAGRTGIFELKQAQQRHLKAQCDEAQSRYEMLIRQMILHFYEE